MKTSFNRIPLFILGSAVAGMLTQTAEASIVTLNAVDSGKFYVSGTASSNAGILTVNPTYRSWLQFDLTSIGDEVIGAILQVGSDSRNTSGQTINFWDVSTSNLHASSAAAYADLGTGTSFGTGIHQSGTINSFTLNGNAIASLNDATGTWAIGLQNMGGGYAFGYTWGVGTGDNLKLVLTLAEPPPPTVQNSVPDSGSTISLMGFALVGLIALNRSKRSAISQAV